MSLNWKEINLILEELKVVGYQIQKIIQSTFDVISFQIHGNGKTKLLLVALTPQGCRLHETHRAVPKPDKPLRFAEFLKSRLTNGWIEEAVQLGDNRIVRFTVRTSETRYILYLRLWSNAANVIVCNEAGTVLDAMRRNPKKGEYSGGYYRPESTMSSVQPSTRVYTVRDIPGDQSFNEKIDSYYAEQGGTVSLETLREQVQSLFEGKIGRLNAAIEKLRAKEQVYNHADRFKEYGDLILANLEAIQEKDEFLETEDFYRGGTVHIPLHMTPTAQAEAYYSQYRKEKHGLREIRAEIERSKAELAAMEQMEKQYLSETNPLKLNKIIKHGDLHGQSVQQRLTDKKRPGLSFRRGEWLLIVGRDSTENDELLRHHVKGADLWLHARDYAGSYVFIKYKAGKTYPLDILLDAGNLALFYSKGRSNGAGDLFYTPVKWLRRVKDGPKALVIPTHEKNLHVVLDDQRLKQLEYCRIEKT
ncbi:MAG: NFACT RNA binding domain-containing protein [Treponema sp.]|jgi:predicted ribosome quality control (RQC) complex YloA/Tae2 family protein|nr:NFACT RNA binding domain-containing protein [Treponema sp.]